jgi:hypothetical protein
MPMQPQTHNGPAAYGVAGPGREPSPMNTGQPGGNTNGPGLTMPAHPEAVVGGPANTGKSGMEAHPEPRAEPASANPVAQP